VTLQPPCAMSTAFTDDGTAAVVKDVVVNCACELGGTRAARSVHRMVLKSSRLGTGMRDGRQVHERWHCEKR
jgi:hypothetical protein